MISSRSVVVAALIVACLGMASCVEDTSKSVHQDPEAYLSRVFVPSALPGSVQDKLAQSTEKPLPFSKLVMKRKSTMKNVITGTTIESTSDVVYQNAGNGLIQELDTEYSNGIEVGTNFLLNYRGIFPLLSQNIKPSARNMPYILKAESIGSMDLSFDRPTLSYTYTYTSNAPRARTQNREMACKFTSTYPASKLNVNIHGMAREFACDSLNDNGVVDYEVDYVYLEDYEIAINKGQHSTRMELVRDIIDFKVE